MLDINNTQSTFIKSSTEESKSSQSSSSCHKFSISERVPSIRSSIIFGDLPQEEDDAAIISSYDHRRANERAKVIEELRCTSCLIHGNSVCLIQNLLSMKKIYICLCSMTSRKKFSCKETKKDCSYCRSSLKFELNPIDTENLRQGLLECSLCRSQITLETLAQHLLEKINPSCSIVPISTMRLFSKLQNLILHLSSATVWEKMLRLD